MLLAVGRSVDDALLLLRLVLLLPTIFSRPIVFLSQCGPFWHGMTVVSSFMTKFLRMIRFLIRFRGKFLVVLVFYDSEKDKNVGKNNNSTFWLVRI